MIFMLCGTRDALELALVLAGQGLPPVASVVTREAAQQLEAVGINTVTGRLDREGMIAMLRKGGYHAVVDASHPFAAEAHANAIAVAAALGLPYFRYERRRGTYPRHPRLMEVSSYEEAARTAKALKGSVMLTTGGKTLAIFARELIGDPDIRLTVRLLPSLENIEKCRTLGIDQRNIIALQGPFSWEMNEALYRQYGTQVMITKESGAEGAVEEKLSAALEMGIFVILVTRPVMPPIREGGIFDSFEKLAAAVKAALAAEASGGAMRFNTK
ncbi:precorrin-6A reductase [Paenibacillus sp. M1]|uniref:Precorrin-6A reductase n=1 Tax=Paenibacillus haidiansis TaxID=1574488 RepID=A0ABU7VUC1_9BACL